MRTPVKTRPSVIALRILFASLIGLCALVSHVRAQETGGQLNGTVTDGSGAVVAGAAVTVTNKATGRAYTAKTAADGRYLAPDLAPGHYLVRFDAAGFAPVE